MSRSAISRLCAFLLSICLMPMPVCAASPDATARQSLMQLGRLQLLGIIVLVACLIGARLVGPVGRRLLLGLLLLTFFALQGRSIRDTYRNGGMYQHPKTMALSNFQIVDNYYHSSEFRGRNVLPLLVADYMPRSRVFLYDNNLYSRELLSWSGRDPDSTFVVGGYESAMDTSSKEECLSRPHIVYRASSNAPLYVATPLSIYEKEDRVFLMTDDSMDYLIPGSWGVSRH